MTRDVGTWPQMCLRASRTSVDATLRVAADIDTSFKGRQLHVVHVLNKL